MFSGRFDLSSENAASSRALAAVLFPNEEWVLKEPHIWVAKTRLPEEYREPDKWEREISHFLPEIDQGGEAAKLCADLVLDGVVTEMKTVSGTRTTLGTAFRFAYRQGAVLLTAYPDIKEHSVFIRLKSGLEIDSVRAKIAGELKNRSGKGRFICYFEHIGKLYSWSYDELRSIINR